MVSTSAARAATSFSVHSETIGYRIIDILHDHGLAITCRPASRTAP